MSKKNTSAAILIDRQDITSHLAIFRFQPSQPFIFRPGQCATLAIEDGERLLQRPYSIASSSEERVLEFFIELVPHGKLTPRLWQLKVGDEILIRDRAVGLLTLDEKNGSVNHLFIASVTGIAPFLSILRTIESSIERGSVAQHSFLILHQADSSDEIAAYLQELERLSQYHWIDYHPILTRPVPDWQRAVGRVEDLLPHYLQQAKFNTQNSIAYVCGHPRLVKTVTSQLKDIHFTRERIKEENYFILKDER